MSKENSGSLSDSEHVFDSPEALEAGKVVDHEKSQEVNIVDWDGPDDAENPHNWSSNKRWIHIVLVSILALITYVLIVFPRVSQIIRTLLRLISRISC